MELVVCIIDDDAFYAKALKHNIERNPDYKSFVFDSAQEFFNQDLVVPDAITLDFNIPNEDCELTLTQVHQTLARHTSVGYFLLKKIYLPR